MSTSLTPCLHTQPTAPVPVASRHAAAPSPPHFASTHTSSHQLFHRSCAAFFPFRSSLVAAQVPVGSFFPSGGWLWLASLCSSVIMSPSLSSGATDAVSDPPAAAEDLGFGCDGRFEPSRRSSSVVMESPKHNCSGVAVLTHTLTHNSQCLHIPVLTSSPQLSVPQLSAPPSHPVPNWQPSGQPSSRRSVSECLFMPAP